MILKETNLILNKKIRQVLFSLYFCMGLAFATWASRIPDIKEMLNLDDAEWGVALLMIPLGIICGMAMSGYVVSKFGSKRIFPVVIIAYLGSLVIITFSNSELMLNVTITISSFFVNFCNIALNTQAVTLEQKYNRPIMASFHGLWSLAGLVGSAVGLLMSSLHISPSIHFTIISIIVVIVVLINYKYLQEDPVKEVITKTSEKQKPERFLYWLGILAFFGMIAESTMFDWSGIYFTQVSGAALKNAPLALVAFMVTTTVGRFFIDKATHKWGAKRVIQVEGLLISAGLFISVLFPSMTTTLIGFMLIGAGSAGIVPIIYSIVGRKSKINTSIALTIVSSISFVSFLAEPLLIGYVSNASSLRISFALVGISGLIIIFMSSRMSIFKNDKS